MAWSRSAWSAVGTVAAFAVVLSGCPKKPQVAVQTAGVQEAQPPSSTTQPVEDVTQPSAVEESPMPAQAAQPATGLADVYFDFDRSDITPGGRTALEQNAKWLLGRGNAQVRVEGHADERGTNEYNIALGERRAQAVKRVLVALGVPAANVSTVSYGEEQPACREHDESCWQKNRRAHLAVR